MGMVDPKVGLAALGGMVVLIIAYVYMFISLFNVPPVYAVGFTALIFGGYALLTKVTPTTLPESEEE